MTGGVITSAGMVLAATFTVLGVLPLVFLADLGFAVAFGVLLDTFIVRAVLVQPWPTTSARLSGGPSKLAATGQQFPRRGRPPGTDLQPPQSSVATNGHRSRGRSRTSPAVDASN